jgi:hypothetical protein
MGSTGMGGAETWGAGMAGTSGGAAGMLGASVGSFTLHLISLTEPNPYVPDMDAPDRYGRLDLRATDGGYVAFVSFAEGTTGWFEVAADQDQFTLMGYVLQIRSPPSMETTYSVQWESFILPRNAAGDLAGTFTASGRSYFSGGWENQGDLPTQGTGTLSRDTTPPSLAIGWPARKGPPGAMLPWDPVLLAVSEPVSAVSWVAATRAVTAGNPGPVPWHSTLLPAAPDDGAGVRQLLVSTGAWDQVRGKTLSLSVEAGLPDPSGNLAAGASADLPVLDVGEVAQVRPLDGSIPFGRWGATLLPAGDPCEAAGCVSLGLAPLTCPVPVAGVAMRVPGKGADTLKVRLRVRHATPGGASPFSLSVTDTAGHRMELDSASLAYPAASGQDGSGNTDWVSFSIHLSEELTGDELGVSIVAGPSSVQADCVFPPTPGQAEVLIGQIGAEKSSTAVKVTDGPLAPGAACNPIGTWKVTWAPPAQNEGNWCDEPQAATIVVSADDQGALLVDDGNFRTEYANSSIYGVSRTASLSADGCQLTVASSFVEKGGSEFWGVTDSVSLTLAGDLATGMYSASNTAFCNGSKTGPATATRTP